MTKVYVKIHETSGLGKVIAISDSDLVGKTLQDNEKDLSFTVSEDFYKGELVELDILPDVLKEGENINIIGNASVDFAIKNGFVDKDGTIEIDGVKHAQIYKL